MSWSACFSNVLKQYCCPTISHSDKKRELKDIRKQLLDQ
jgi:hypothetical protein